MATALFMPSMSPASADAETYAPLVETTCSYEQIVAALRVEDPSLSAMLDQYPIAQDKLREFVALSVDQRYERIDQGLDDNPDWQARLEEKLATPAGADTQQALLDVAATCLSY
ncbi:MAG: hemophore-related protein [Mycobacterium sp.]